jgi:hypothetical protein
VSDVLLMTDFVDWIRLHQDMSQCQIVVNTIWNFSFHKTSSLLTSQTTTSFSIKKMHFVVYSWRCRWLENFSSEDVSIMLVRNVGIYRQVHTALQHRRLTSTLVSQFTPLESVFLYAERLLLSVCCAVFMFLRHSSSCRPLARCAPYYTARRKQASFLVGRTSAVLEAFLSAVS